MLDFWPYITHAVAALPLSLSVEPYAYVCYCVYRHSLTDSGANNVVAKIVCWIWFRFFFLFDIPFKGRFIAFLFYYIPCSHAVSQLSADSFLGLFLFIFFLFYSLFASFTFALTHTHTRSPTFSTLKCSSLSLALSLEVARALLSFGFGETFISRIYTALLPYDVSNIIVCFCLSKCLTTRLRTTLLARIRVGCVDLLCDFFLSSSLPPLVAVASHTFVDIPTNKFVTFRYNSQYYFRLFDVSRFCVAAFLYFLFLSLRCPFIRFPFFCWLPPSSRRLKSAVWLIVCTSFSRNFLG